MRFLASISYDGSKFYGFQRLNKKKTVQGELEKVLKKLNKTVVYVKGAGRTDRGVHAISQMVHFDLNINIEPASLVLAMNSMLDPAIYVNECQIVASDFHARFDVKYKIYEYIINVGEYNPLEDNYLWNYNHDLNIKAMKKACQYLKGMNSYEVFTSGERESYNSIIYGVSIKKHRDSIIIRFKGKSFYRYMVRNMVGALMLVGKNKVKPIAIKEMMCEQTNKYNYATAPANGLYLVKVAYK